MRTASHGGESDCRGEVNVFLSIATILRTIIGKSGGFSRISAGLLQKVARPATKVAVLATKVAGLATFAAAASDFCRRLSAFFVGCLTADEIVLDFS